MPAPWASTFHAIILFFSFRIFIESTCSNTDYSKNIGTNIRLLEIDVILYNLTWSKLPENYDQS